MSETASGTAGPAQVLAFDGQVGEEKLAELLALGAEHSSLDFKRELNLNEPIKKTRFHQGLRSHDEPTPGRVFGHRGK